MGSLNFKFKYFFLLIVMIIVFVQCDDDDDMIDNPIIEMDITKSHGHGQYQLKTESGDNVNISLTISSSSILKSLKIKKTKNLQTDESYSEQGEKIVFSSSTELAYTYSFEYTPSVEDVDQLIGFTFSVENENGNVTESDVTMIVTLSPRDNLTRRRWGLKSKQWITDPDTPNSEGIADCEKDNAMILGEDASVTIDYGSDTGAGDCLFDGFNVYTNWSLSDDEKIFSRTYYGIFSPDNVITEIFDVKTLTVDKIELIQTMDLSAFGLGSEEKYLFVYDAMPL